MALYYTLTRYILRQLYIYGWLHNARAVIGENVYLPIVVDSESMDGLRMTIPCILDVSH